jgi:predicted nucleic acid-binding protein
MIAVCNTSPISSLTQIGHLALLERLFTELWIPPEVALELDEGVDFLGDWRTVPGAGSIRTRPVENQALRRDLSGRVHLGEAAAIALTTEIDDAVLVIDDSSGRRIAAGLGLRFTGTVGLLLAAKRAGHVDRIAPLLEDLRLRARFWISDGVLRRALELAGE